MFWFVNRTLDQNVCIDKMLVGTLYFNPEELNTSRLRYWPSGKVINRAFIDLNRNLYNYILFTSLSTNKESFSQVEIQYNHKRIILIKQFSF